MEREVDPKYTLTPKLWEYLYNYAKKHKEKGNGFGFGLVGPDDVARTLSARYYKDAQNILVDQGWDFSKDFNDKKNLERRPRRLTPLGVRALWASAAHKAMNLRFQFQILKLTSSLVTR